MLVPHIIYHLKDIINTFQMSADRKWFYPRLLWYYRYRMALCDIASSSAPEVTSSYVTTWVRVGVNRAQALYDIVASSVFHTFPFCSIEFWTMYSASFS